MPQIDEPIAISRAIQSMIKSVNTNNRTLKTINNDLIVSLTALRNTITQSFTSMVSENKRSAAKANAPRASVSKPVNTEMLAANKELVQSIQALNETLKANKAPIKTSKRGRVVNDVDENGFSNNSLVLGSIYNSINTTNSILQKTLGDVPYLTSGTARHETDNFRQSVLDALKKIANLSGGLGGLHNILPPIRPGAPGVTPVAKNAAERGVVADAEGAGEGVIEGAIGAEGIQLLNHGTPAQKASVLAKLKRIPGLGALGSGLGLVARGAGVIGGGYVGYQSASNINSGDQNKAFFGGSQGIVGSTAMNYAGSIGGDALAGASLGGPWGALIGGGVGLSAALYQEYSPQINSFADSVVKNAGSLITGVTGWLTTNLPSWDTVKTDINTAGNAAGHFVSNLTKSLSSIESAVSQWQITGDLKTLYSPTNQSGTTKPITHRTISTSPDTYTGPPITDWWKNAYKNLSNNTQAPANQAPVGRFHSQANRGKTNAPYYPQKPVFSTYQMNKHHKDYPTGPSVSSALVSTLQSLYTFLNNNYNTQNSKKFGTSEGVRLMSYDPTQAPMFSNGVANVGGAQIIQAAYTPNFGTSYGQDSGQGYNLPWMNPAIDQSGDIGTYNSNGYNLGTPDQGGSPNIMNPSSPSMGNVTPNYLTGFKDTAFTGDQAKKLAALTFNGKKIPANQINGILAAAAKYNVDPRVIASVFRNESGFDPKAHSSVPGSTATGEGQFIHSTATGQNAAGKQVGPNYLDGRNINDSSVAADMTGHYLSDLLKQYKGNMGAALYAYAGGAQGGPGNAAYVASELKMAGYVNNGPEVASTPFTKPKGPAQQLAARHADPAKVNLSPTRPAGSSPVPTGTVAGNYPSLNNIPMHITDQGLIIVNSGSGMG